MRAGKLSGPNLVIYLNQTLMFGWCVWIQEQTNKEVCSKEIGLLAHNLTHLGYFNEESLNAFYVHYAIHGIGFMI